MELAKAQTICSLYKSLKEAEDKIEFFEQFFTKSSEKSVAFFFGRKQKPPKLGIATIYGNGDGYFEPDEELIGFLIDSYKAKKDSILKEIDAL